MTGTLKVNRLPAGLGFGLRRNQADMHGVASGKELQYFASAGHGGFAISHFVLEKRNFLREATVFHQQQSGDDGQRQAGKNRRNRPPGASHDYRAQSMVK